MVGGARVELARGVLNIHLTLISVPTILYSATTIVYFCGSDETRTRESYVYSRIGIETVQSYLDIYLLLLNPMFTAESVLRQIV